MNFGSGGGDIFVLDQVGEHNADEVFIFLGLPLQYHLFNDCYTSIKYKQINYFFFYSHQNYGAHLKNKYKSTIYKERRNTK